MKIYMSGEQIRSLAEYALGIEIDSEKCDQQFCLETDVSVDGVTEDFYVHDTDYPEEGGSVLRTELVS